MYPGMGDKALKERSDKARECLAVLDCNAAVDLTRAALLRRKPAAASTVAEAGSPLTSTKRVAKGKRRTDGRPDDKV